MARATGLDHVVIAASQLERCLRFYRDVLGAAVVAMPRDRVALRVGGQQLNVHTPETTAAPLAAAPVGPGNSDLCFSWDGPIETAVDHLKRLGVAIVEGPVARTGARGPGRSVYCRDPMEA